MRVPVLLPAQLSAHLKSLRQARGLSQAQLGRMLGVGQVRVANIEADPGAISVEQFMKILTLLGARLELTSELAAGAETAAKPVAAGPRAARHPGASASQAGDVLNAPPGEKPLW